MVWIYTEEIVNNNIIKILHTGRVAHGKGQIDAIKACDILVKNNINFELNLVGSIDKSYNNSFLKFYNSCKYKEKINIIGFKSNISPYLQEADIFLFPSYGEGFGNSFAEALTSNLICIAYANTSFFNFKNLGFYFLMVKNKDIKDLKNNLLFVSLNIDSEEIKTKNNHELALTLFSTSQEIKKYLEILV